MDLILMMKWFPVKFASSDLTKWLKSLNIWIVRFFFFVYLPFIPIINIILFSFLQVIIISACLAYMYVKL